MKKMILFSGLLFLLLTAGAQEKTDSLGLPGDNLNLYAVLNIFQQSPTLEAFEQKLNEENNRVNNLDLNKDDQIDYIKVVAEQSGNNHTIILQVYVTEKEIQDLAVIEVSKDKKGKIIIQLIGNEELYGKDYIIEPADLDEKKTSTPNPGYQPKQDQVVKQDKPEQEQAKSSTGGGSNIQIRINLWPMWGYLYAPGYVVYRSPWYWGYYPGWWSPWRPWYWHDYYYHHYHYHWHWSSHYRRSNYYRLQQQHWQYRNRVNNASLVQQYKRDHRFKDSYTRPGDRVGPVLPADKRRPVMPQRPAVSRPVTLPSSGFERPRPSKPAVYPERPMSRPAQRPTFEQRPMPARPQVRPAPAGGGMSRPATRPAMKPAGQSGQRRSGNE